MPEALAGGAALLDLQEAVDLHVRPRLVLSGHPASIEVRIRDAAGQPVPGAKVRLRVNDWTWDVISGVPLVTGDDGWLKTSITPVCQVSKPVPADYWFQLDVSVSVLGAGDSNLGTAGPVLLKVVLTDNVPLYYEQLIPPYPEEATPIFSRECQGLTTDGARWFFSCNRHHKKMFPQLADYLAIWRFPSFDTLDTDISLADLTWLPNGTAVAAENPAIVAALLPADLLTGGYLHIGDVDYYDGLIFAPFEY